MNNLGSNTKLLMPNGIKSINEIITDDNILLANNFTAKVIANNAKSDELYLIKADSSELTVNRDYVLAVINKETRKQVDISIEDYLKLSEEEKTKLALKRKIIEYEEKELPADPYFIGLWLGELKYSYSITTEHKPIINYLKSYAKSLNMTLSKKKEKDVIRYDIVNKQSKLNLAQKLTSFKSNDKYIANEALYNTIQNRKAILAGLIDSIGTLVNNDIPHYELHTVNINLADSIVKLIQSLGYKVFYNTETEYNQTYNRYCSVYKISFYGDFSNNSIPSLLEENQYQGNNDNNDDNNNANKNNALIDFTVTAIGEGPCYELILNTNMYILSADYICISTNITSETSA